MTSQTRLENLCTDGALYDEKFIERFGYTSPFWSNSNWFQREASLRHDMVCMLLCNTEPSNFFDREKIIECLEPPEKRQRIENAASGSSGKSTDTSSTEIGSDIHDEDFVDIGEDSRYRYTLLEGRTNIVQIQNKICNRFGIDKLTKQYDIFDIKEKKFIEVKVTRNLNKSVDDFNNYFDPIENIALVHLHPEHTDVSYIGKNDKMPGEGKAISFLMRRLSLMQMTFNIQESDIECDQTMGQEIFINNRFNDMVEIWQNSFWDLRHLPLKETDTDPLVNQTIGILKESELKMMIEDTTKRTGKFMEFKAKLLPCPFTSHILTSEKEDKEMLNALLDGVTFEGDEYLGWVIERWHETQNNFNLLTPYQIREAPKSLIRDLGMGQKGTVRNDNFADLIQPEFKSPERLKYSAWMSNLMKDMTNIDDEELIYFPQMQESEFMSNHPIGKLSQDIVNKIFEIFGETSLAAYCSKVRNFYSRLGGAYLKRDMETSKRPSVVMFPLYSTGHRGNSTIRKVTGFIVRGPQHAKKPTDRIPYISCELMGTTGRSNSYQKFIKKPHFKEDSKGRKWCLRVNSIMKHDTSYLTFVIDSIYLTSNMIGEMTFHQQLQGDENKLRETAEMLINGNKQWFLERMVESVFMAVMGGSQEEGTLSALRKMFMLKLNWSRGNNAWGSDLQGFADSLNECLMDQPLALYFAKQFRDVLND